MFCRERGVPVPDRGRGDERGRAASQGTETGRWRMTENSNRPDERNPPSIRGGGEGRAPGPQTVDGAETEDDHAQQSRHGTHGGASSCGRCNLLRAWRMRGVGVSMSAPCCSAAYGGHRGAARPSPAACELGDPWPEPACVHRRPRSIADGSAGTARTRRSRRGAVCAATAAVAGCAARADGRRPCPARARFPGP